MQTYGLLNRLLEEGNHMHMVVRLSTHFASSVFAQTFSELLMSIYLMRERG